GTLEKLERQRAQVRVGGKTVMARAKDLVGVDPEAAADRRPRSQRLRDHRARLAARPRNVRSADASASDAEAGAGSERELHLLGRQVDGALVELDRFLDRALLGSLSSVRVVHGHGTGRLRAAVRDHLRGHPAVSSQRPGRGDEGGDGATVVTLAGAG
ncbi:MAG: Smr/MutS family protein, partial [Acidobacteriota bacterium]